MRRIADPTHDICLYYQPIRPLFTDTEQENLRTQYYVGCLPGVIEPDQPDKNQTLLDFPTDGSILVTN